MAGKIKVNTDSLSRTAQTISERLSGIESQIDELLRDLYELDSMWEGESHDVYHHDFESNLSELKELCKSVTNIRNYEEQSAAQYSKCENQVRSLVESIRI